MSKVQFVKQNARFSDSTPAGRRIIFPPWGFVGQLVAPSKGARLYFLTDYILQSVSLFGEEGNGINPTTINVYVNNTVIASLDLVGIVGSEVQDLNKAVSRNDYAWIEAIASGGHTNTTVQLDGIQIV